MKQIRVSCPKCGWEPDDTCKWMCDVCQTRWNTFDTHGRCPGCGKVFIDTQCSKRRGGCGQMSLNADWYEEIEIVKPKSSLKSLFSWGNKDRLPITENDKKWVERSLVLLSELFEPIYFKSLATITPD